MRGPGRRPRLPGGLRPAVATLILILAVTATIGAILVYSAGQILEAVGEGDGIALWDRPVLDWAVQQRTPVLTATLLWFTTTGGPLWQPIIMLSIALLLWWRWRDPTPMLLILATEVGAVAISAAAKRVVNRARPPTIDAVFPYETSPSFPSGHTMQAFAIATILAYLLIRHIGHRHGLLRAAIGAIALVYASTMGFSRVFLGYHWLTDVIAAACLGVAWAAVVIACHRLWLEYKGRDAADAAHVRSPARSGG